MNDDPNACPKHRHQPADHCGDCRVDAIVASDMEAFIAWYANVQKVECAKRFPPRFRDAIADHLEVQAWLEQWHTDPGTCRSLMLTGTVGTGKTWQAFGALRGAVTGGRAAIQYTRGWHGWRLTSWVATTAADMYASLRPQPKHDTEAELARYRDADLLLIDDLGATKPSEWVEETTYRILGGRYDAMRPTILTSNLPPQELKVAIGDRIASRFAETCVRVVMTGPDRRRRRPGESGEAA